MLLKEAVEVIFSGRAIPRGTPGDPEVPIVGMRDVGAGLAPIERLERVPVPAGAIPDWTTLRAGDVVATSRAAHIRAAVVEDEHRGVAVGPNLVVVRPSERLSGRLVAALMRNPAVQGHLLAEFASRTPPGFTVERLGRLRITLPTSTEQEDMAGLVAATEAYVAAVTEAARLRQAATYDLVCRRLREPEA